MINRQHSADDLSRVKHKRVYRLKARAMACCQKHPEANNRVTWIKARSRSLSSDQRWCSDGFETKCDYGQTITATFAKDGCDREIPAWRAREGKGLSGETVRGMLTEAVEKCFGTVESVPGGHKLEFLSDYGSDYIAAQTRNMPRALGLKPHNAPVCSP